MSGRGEPPDSREEILFAEVFDLAPGERAAHLERACGGDDALRSRVEALVAASGAAGDFLDFPAAEARDFVARPGSGEREGDRIGPFRLVSEIGEGGCGTVFLAEQEEPVRREVALKIIKLGMDTREVVARFAFERQALASMDHPHIAHVFDAGETPTGRPFFAMELVRGIRVTRYCDGGRLSLAGRLELFLQACSAIQHAHQKGVIHRDIKSSNVLVCEVDGAPSVKVIDFGIAKATDQRRPGDDSTLTLTSAGQFVGTPAYMSPEQAGLGGREIDTRSDIYSLGVLLYELLAGTTPLDSRELLRLGLDEVCRVIRKRDTVWPSKRLADQDEGALVELAALRRTEPSALVKTLQGDLDWIVARAMEKDPARRYESVGALAADIQRYIRHEPVLACPPSRLYVLRKLVQRHRLPFVAGTAVATSLVVGLAVSSHLYVEEQAARATAEEALARADREAEIANAVNEFLQVDILRQASTWMQAEAGYRPEGNLSIRTAVERAAATVGERFAGRPVVEAAVRLAIGQAFVGLYDYARAEEHFLRAVALREAHLGPNHVDTYEARVALATTYRLWPRPEQALALFEELLPALEREHGFDHPDTLSLKRELGTVYRFVGRYPEAVQIFQDSVARHRAEADGGAAFIIAIYNLGYTYLVMEEPGLALGPLEEALRLSEERLGPRHPRTYVCQRVFGDALWNLGRHDEAAPALEKALQMDRENRGWNFYDVLRFREDLEERFEGEGMVDRALALRREYIAQQREHNGVHHLDFKTAVAGYLDICRRGDRPTEAVAALVPVCEEFLERLGDFPPGSAGREHLSYFLERLVAFGTEGGRHEEAARWQEQLDALAPRAE